jgi:hypothetical protein
MRKARIGRKIGFQDGIKCSAIEEVVHDGHLPRRRAGQNISILKSDLDSFLSSLEIIPVPIAPSVLKHRRERAQAGVAA